MALVKCGEITIHTPTNGDPEFYKTFLSKDKSFYQINITYQDTKKNNPKKAIAYLTLNMRKPEESDFDDTLEDKEGKKAIDTYMSNNYSVTFNIEGYAPKDFARYKKQILDCTKYSFNYYNCLITLLNKLEYSSEVVEPIKQINDTLQDLKGKLESATQWQFLTRIKLTNPSFVNLAALIRAHEKRDFNKDIMKSMNKIALTLQKELDDLPITEKNVLDATIRLMAFRNAINSIDNTLPIEGKLQAYLQALNDLDLNTTKQTINETQDKLRCIDKISQIQKRNGEIINYNDFNDINNHGQLKTLTELEKMYNDKQEDYTQKKHEEQEQKTLEQLRENKFEKQVDEFISTISIKNENQQAKKTTETSRSKKPHQKKAKQSPQQYLSIVPMEKKEQHNYLSYLLVTLLGGVLLGGIIALLMYNDKQKKIQNQQARLQLKSAQDRQPNI